MFFVVLKMFRQKPAAIKVKKTGFYVPPAKGEKIEPSYKGAKTGTVEHRGGPKDEYFYQGAETEIVFERKTLSDNLQKLRPYQDVMVDFLSPESRELFVNIMSQGNRLDKTPLYKIFLETVSEVFANPTILPGTVASHLAGCPVVYDENNLGGCDPRCLSSLPLADNPNSNLCERTVLVYKDGKIVILQNKGTSEAILLIYDQNFSAINEQSKQLLAKMEISKFHVLRLQADRTFSPVTVETMDDLLLAKPKDTTTTNSSNFWWILLAVILIIFLILVVIYIINWYNKKNQLAPVYTR